jgi:hypothetical protein
MAKRLSSLEELLSSAYPDRQLALFVVDEAWQAAEKLPKEEAIANVPPIALAAAAAVNVLIPLAGIAFSLLVAAAEERS